MKIGFTERGDAALHFADVKRVIATGQYAGAVLITKSPHLLLKQLARERMSLGIPYIVHCTITGLGDLLEPNVQPTEITMPAFHALHQELGDRCVLRVDPIIPTVSWVNIASSIIAQSRNARVRISFMDNYPHVRERFTDLGLNELSYIMHAPIGVRMAALAKLQEVSEREIEVCGEPDMKCVGCISPLDLQVMGLHDIHTGKSQQRKACACMGLKAEMLQHRGQCAHRCVYCYWR